jgi:putative nucleotidyltransferase with HDIG domain
MTVSADLQLPPDPAMVQPGGVPVPALENLASRLRASGVMLMYLKLDGRVAWHDSQAATFFHRYALPLIQFPDGGDDPVQRRLQTLTPASGIGLWRQLPGLLLAAFPCVNRRQVVGAVVLCGKASSFKLCEDVVRACSRLGIDGIWLAQQADQIPAFGDESLETHAKLAMGIFQDQLRLTSLEGELNSLSTQLSNTYEELSLIYQLSGGMSVNRGPTDFFKQACLDVMEVIGVRGMGVGLRGTHSAVQEPVLYGVVSLPPGTVHRLADELVGKLRGRSTPLLINHLASDPHFGWLGDHARQLLAVPLQRRDTMFGVLFALDKRNGEFDTIDSKLLNSIANESGIYLENSVLYEDVRGLMMGLLHSLTSAVDAKDAYTCGHSERVALVSRLLAKEAGMTDAQVERVYMAGLLHDVGKIGVPEGVLQKTGRLTPEEFEQIKKHPEIGARILRDIRQIEDIIPGVLHHHERYDGKGYPSGLAGEAIPLLGRIICLADCFDAMTSSRTYRKALPLEVALTEIRRCAGTQFDPGLSDTFLGIGAEPLRALLHQHQEQSRNLTDLQKMLRSN